MTSENQKGKEEEERTMTSAVSRNGYGNVLPSSFSQVGTIIRYELRNYFRSRRFYILLIIGLAIAGLLTAVVGYYRPATFLSSTLGFYSEWWGNSVTFVVILSGIFFGGDAISGEFQNKTGYFLVGNPLRRSSIYIGKWVAAFVASLIILGIYTAITVANQVYYFGLSTPIPYEFGESFVFSIIYLIAVLGFTFFFSSLFKSSSMSILVTVILFLFAFSTIQLFVEDLAQIEPWFIITYGAGIIGNVLSSPYPETSTVHLGGPRGPTFTSFVATVPEGIAILLVYFAVTAVLGLYLFERKEFN